MPNTSKYVQAIEDYNREKDGTMKEYCQRLGLNYAAFKNRRCIMMRKAGIPAKKLTNLKPYFEELEQSKEPVKAFCEKNGLKYETFRVAWYQYRKKHGIEVPSRKRNPK